MTSSCENSKTKKLSNPASTGSAGPSFESRVQASRLLAMCLGTLAPGIVEGRIVELKFQALIHGHHTDDLVCVVEGANGQRKRTLLQMKRSIVPRANDKAFADSLVAAWTDYKNSVDFDKGSDSIFIVYDNAKTAAMKGAATVCEWARYSANAPEFLKKVAAKNFSNQTNRNALAAIRKVVETHIGGIISDDELYDFSAHLTFLSQDLDQEGTAEHTNYLSSILQAARLARENVNAQEVWSALVIACMGVNAKAGTVTFDNLGICIGQRLNTLFAFARDFNTIPSVVGRSTPCNADAGLAGTNLILSEVSRLSSLLESFGQNGIPASTQDQLPAARESSANHIISAQLDGAHTRIKEFRYRDALEDLVRLEPSLSQFDAHQKARWYLLRGACKWHLEDAEQAAIDFIQAAELCSDDDKFVAARIRGLLLRGDTSGAAAEGIKALKRFPDSIAVWQVTANAQMNLGEVLTAEDIPIVLRSEPDAWQTLAWSRHAKGDKTGAVEAAIKALEVAPPTFFSRDAALLLCLDKVAGDALSATFIMLSNEDRLVLQKCVTEFAPREEHLWRIQSPALIAATARNLACAYLVLGQPEVTLNILQEARAHGIDSPHFLRVELEGLARAGHPERALALGKSQIETLPNEALATFAQLASENDDLDSIRKCIRVAKNLQPAQPSLVCNLSAMLLITQAKVEPIEALAAINEVDLENSSSIPELVAASQVLREAKRAKEADTFLQRAVSLLSNDTELGERYLVAQALFFARKLEQAATVYEQIAPLGKHSQLHANLLFCYLRSGRRAKAKQLIDTFPATWELDDDTRRMAMELGQQAGDWEFLSGLVEIELTQAPTKVRSWLFKVMVAARTSAEEVAQAIKNAPLELTGDPREISRLASLELCHGYQERALARLYVMRRNRLDSTEVAAAHLLAHMGVKDGLPQMEEELPVFVQGASITIKDNLGGIKFYTLDPIGLPSLPPTSEFLLPDSEEASILLGKGVGAEIETPDGQGQSKVLVVQRVCTAYRRLLELSQTALDSPLFQSPIVQKFRVVDEETGVPDFSVVTNKLRQFNQHATNAIDAYASSPITLGGLARILGRDVFDLVRGWPSDGPSLQVSSGSPQETARLIAEIKGGYTTYLIDSATLVEFAMLNGLGVLTTLPRVLVTSHTYDLLKGKLAEAKTERFQGTAFEHEGQLGYVEVTPDMRAREIQFLQSIVDVMDNYCQVVPAYGTDEIAPFAVQMERAISIEEHSVVLAAAEYNAILISLDARLRFFASTLGIHGVWPQVLLAYGREKGVITQATYSLACVRQLLANRTFISITPEDLTLMVYQGTTWLNIGVKCFKKQLSSSETEFHSALGVVVRFLALLAAGPCHVGAACQLIEQLTEALFRHKEAPENLENLLVDEIVRVLPIEVPLIRASVHKGNTASCQMSSSNLNNVRVLMISEPPWIAFTPENEADTENLSSSAMSAGSNTRHSAMAGATTASDSADNPFR